MNLIKQYHNTLDKDFCNDIIRIYNESDNITPGVTFSGLNPLIKKTLDLHFKNIDKEKIVKYDTQLHSILNKYINEYFKEINCVSSNAQYIDRGFQIQRYIQNEGFYIYHHDEDINLQLKEMRILTYIFYLNTIEEGGETEFFGTTKIKPEQGKLVLFPAYWCFPHQGKMPISDDKYIVTGWLYKMLK
jgi:hypothetical protein